ncbi:MAG: DsrE family protein [Rhodospirillales bacterium]|nr:DsrE family protein [Rhodospirillales bacterium]
MKKTRQSFAVIFAALAIFALLIGLQTQPAQAADKPGLFVNLTTDDTWAATKAIMFAHKKALNKGHKPVTIWLNVRGIYLIDKKRPSHTHGLMKKNIHAMLQDFIKDGGRVLACQACSKAAGLTKGDFIEGVTMGSTELVYESLYGKDIRSLSW